MRFTFNKSERLKSRKDISALYNAGQSVKGYPLRVLWMLKKSTDPAAVKVAFSAPRRSFRRAVDRNLLKRRMREAYRLNKFHLNSGLELPENHQLILLCIYTSREILSFEDIQRGMRKAFARLAEQMSDS